MLLAALLAVWGGVPVQAQPLDSLATPIALPDSADVRTPRGAVTRSLLLPGLGQVYNREAYKAPIAAGLVVGSIVFAVARQRSYTVRQRAAIYAGCQPELGGDPDSSPERVELCTEEAPDYLDEWQALGMESSTAAGSRRDRARGQRDVGVLVVAVAYAFQALDAYVAAELADFDVSEDVVVRVAPGLASPELRLTVRL